MARKGLALQGAIWYIGNMGERDEVKPEDLARSVATKPDIPVGQGMFRSRLGLRTTQFVDIKERHKKRIARSYLGRLHLEQTQNGC